MVQLALYRSYRPLELSDVVGQKHVTDTLDKAFQKGSIGHAYLLTGPRGTGKTSVARIIARRVNQLPADVDITRELDIIEIDAASNRGIDEIRALRDKLATAPSTLRYKVFIIDEVHMLTREAFNALLKTLEEPPPHVIFVLATTEVHKLPDTIISRTQRHDFRLITAADLAETLKQVAAKEQLEIDDDALQLIAEQAQGGFRDALSLLDQLASRGEPITGAVVAQTAGIGDIAQVKALVTAITQGQTDVALKTLNSLTTQGAEPTVLTEYVLGLMRNEFLSAPREQAARHAHILRALSRAASEQRSASIPSLPLELAIWELTQPVAAPTRETAQMPVQSNTTTAPKPAATQATSPAKPRAVEQTAPATGLNDSVIATKALSLIKTKNNSLYAILRSGEPKLDGDRLTIRCRFRFHKERIEEARNRQLIETIFTKAAGRTIELRVEHTTAPETTQADTEGGNQELVASALEILGGEVIE